MRYRVIVTVDVDARTSEAAEREALKAIVSDIAGWSAKVIQVETQDLESTVGRCQECGSEIRG